MIYLYDSVLEQIKADIGDHQPERGGALLGEPGKPIITKFIFDSNAFTTSSTYSPSRKLNKKVRGIEENEGLEFKGIIHSHPNHFDEPSGQDIVEVATGLRINQHMPFYLLPIVTIRKNVEIEPHELAMDETKISFYGGFPNATSGEEETSHFSEYGISLRKMKIKLIPESLLTRDLRDLCDKREGLQNPEVFIVASEQELMLAGKIEVEDQFELIFLVDLDYPNSRPRLLLTHADGRQKESEPSWIGEASFMEKLEQLITDKIKSLEVSQQSSRIRSKPIQIKIAAKNDPEKKLRKNAN